MTNTGQISNGFGSQTPRWRLHIANRPPLSEFELEGFRSLADGEAADIIRMTSNHWRKVFSIVAKISFALFDTQCVNWQEYRDSRLLTVSGFEAISFDHYDTSQETECISIIGGFTYANSHLSLEDFCPVQDHEKLLVSKREACIVTPYFDWRQLTNETLAALIDIMRDQRQRLHEYG